MEWHQVLFRVAASHAADCRQVVSRSCVEPYKNTHLSHKVQNPSTAYDHQPCEILRSHGYEFLSAYCFSHQGRIDYQPINQHLPTNTCLLQPKLPSGIKHNRRLLSTVRRELYELHDLNLWRQLNAIKSCRPSGFNRKLCIIPNIIIS
jgi:hypothetical protein